MRSIRHPQMKFGEVDIVVIYQSLEI
ncbi:uncharacterized protein METZ01_LOCUS502022 [marine metagenome]|uniref:Uncharacterized protein n=1 Tax=marine metagenome TaxID=408172 RepID=A0A383DZ87_9ZZZZ